MFCADDLEHKLFINLRSFMMWDWLAEVLACGFFLGCKIPHVLAAGLLQPG